MTEFLIRHFVKDYEHTEEVSVRTQYGTLASVVGIFCNVLLFAAKAVIGLLMHSISVTADAFNNLSDAASSVIGLIGGEDGGKAGGQGASLRTRKDGVHNGPCGLLPCHRGGLYLFQGRHRPIREPQPMEFSVVSVLILLLSVCVKLWMSFFNRRLGKRIDSKVMLATAADAIGDVITTAATVFSLLFFYFTGWNIDGFIGLCVSLVVMWAGIGIVRDTLKPLLGEAIDPADYKKISGFVESYDGIVGSHDLIVHNYGPGRNMASIHAEVPNDVDIESSHEIIDRIERDAVGQLGVFLVIHMDPVETKDEEILAVKRQVQETVSGIDPEVSIHDLRVVEGRERINVIFDMVVPYRYTEEEEKELAKTVRKKLRQVDHRYQCVITTEKSYIAQGEEE